MRFFRRTGPGSRGNPSVSVGEVGRLSFSLPSSGSRCSRTKFLSMKVSPAPQSMRALTSTNFSPFDPLLVSETGTYMALLRMSATSTEEIHINGEADIKTGLLIKKILRGVN
jgi:hypothetical protein